MIFMTIPEICDFFGKTRDFLKMTFYQKCSFAQNALLSIPSRALKTDFNDTYSDFLNILIWDFCIA